MLMTCTKMAGKKDFRLLAIWRSVEGWEGWRQTSFEFNKEGRETRANVKILHDKINLNG